MLVMLVEKELVRPWIRTSHGNAIYDDGGSFLTVCCQLGRFPTNTTITAQ